MKAVQSVLVAGFLIGLYFTMANANPALIAGESEFKEHCAACHADGGNIIKPDKTLSRKDREKHGVKSSSDIVNLMRHPGEGMITFDAQTLPDKEAHDIANYIIRTFE